MQLTRISLDLLRAPLQAARPSSRWAQDEPGAVPCLPANDGWPILSKGVIDNIHGMTDWGVTATLGVRNHPVLAVVYLPLTGEDYIAVRISVPLRSY
jgi:myo-inositol-1(or 4)-monophosphatase